MKKIQLYTYIICIRPYLIIESVYFLYERYSKNRKEQIDDYLTRFWLYIYGRSVARRYSNTFITPETTDEIYRRRLIEHR